MGSMAPHRPSLRTPVKRSFPIEEKTTVDSAFLRDLTHLDARAAPDLADWLVARGFQQGGSDHPRLPS
jgi:hypothetical protein